MVASKFIYITLVLTAFCICNGMGGPMADPDPGVMVDVKINVNDNCDSPGGCSGDHEEHKPDCSCQDCNKDCEHWCYPSKDWPLTCAPPKDPRGFCNGKQQSPIDISTGSTTSVTGSLLTFSASYSVAIDKITIKNNGHSVGASLEDILPTRTISGGGLSGTYTLAQFHFHWGCEDYRGSEHVVDGTRYAMELHLVHFKTSYKNLKNASGYSDGLAVLGIFFNVDVHNGALDPITRNLANVVAYGDTESIIFGQSLRSLIPTQQTFYRYQGSLTTPTCNEVVIWSVFSSHLTFSEAQAKEFRKLHDKENCKMCDNYRGIQPLNGRVVEKYQI